MHKLLLGAALAALAMPAAANAVAYVHNYTPANTDFFKVYGSGMGSTVVASFQDGFSKGSSKGTYTFTTTYAFQVVADGLGSGSFITSTQTALTKLLFTSISVNGTDYSAEALSSDGTMFSDTDIPLFGNGYVNQIVIKGQVLGRNGGSFGGNATYIATAVPEPASWALMIGGVGILGAALRRRQTVAVRYA